MLFSEISDFTRFGTGNAAYQALNLRKTKKVQEKVRNFLFSISGSNDYRIHSHAMEENRHCIFKGHNSLKVIEKGGT